VSNSHALSTQVRGIKREQLAKKIQTSGVQNTFYDIVGETPVEILAATEGSIVPSKDVMRKIMCDYKKSQLFSKDEKKKLVY
jgi:hypothetical protein